MKVYWSSAKGAVICSANASRIALARNGSKEAGVMVPPHNVNIDRLIRYVRPRRVTDQDLRRLGRLSDRIAAARPRDLRTPQDDLPTLAEWLASSAHRPFRVGAVTAEAEFSKSAKAVAKRRFNVAEPHSSIGMERRNDANVGEWVLLFDADTGRGAEWLYVNFVVPLTRSEIRRAKGDRYDAVQLYPNRDYPPPPFRLERAGRDTLAEAVTEIGPKELTTTTRLSRAFRSLLRKHAARSS
jgi:hypothetical protein